MNLIVFSLCQILHTLSSKACDYGQNPAPIGTSVVIGGHKNKKEKPVQDEKVCKASPTSLIGTTTYHNLFKVYKILLGDMLPFQL